MRQRPAEYIPQIPEQLLLLLCPQEADEITWPDERQPVTL